MDWFSRRFLKAALIWLGLGVLAGVAIAVRPQWTLYRPAHAHMTVAGFVAMTIFGVAYHVIPRFTGHRLHSPRLAGFHWYTANSGLALLLAGFVLPNGTGSPGRALVIGGGILTALSAWLFIYNMWRTMDGPPPVAPAMGRPLQVMDPRSPRGTGA